MLPVLAVVAALQGPANCDRLRYYIATYGEEVVLQGARARGYTEEQIRGLIKRCKIKTAGG